MGKEPGAAPSLGSGLFPGSLPVPKETRATPMCPERHFSPERTWGPTLHRKWPSGME